MVSDDIKSIDETPQEERYRMLSILSYAVVLLGVGLPLWWATTRVYRAPLPLDEMLELRPEELPPLKVFVRASTEERTKILIDEMNIILGSTINLIPFSPAFPSIPVGSLLLQESSSSVEDILIAPPRSILYRPGISASRLAHLLLSWPGTQPNTLTALARENSPSEINRMEDDKRAFPAAKDYDVMVTIVENDGRRLQWDVQGALEDYVIPYLSSLSSVANFTVKSSVLRYCTLGIRGRRVGSSGALAEALLAHGVASLETRLAGHLAKRPQLHLVLYIVPCSEAPLYIYTRAGMKAPGKVPSFISPRWGGVQILNPDCSDEKWAPDIELVMSTAVTQIARLLGVPGPPPGTKLADKQGSTPFEWQLDWMVRARIKEYLDAARLTLRSLAQLLSEISNIVISDEVADSVHKAVAAIGSSQRYLQADDVTSALASAQKAALDAEAAFTDPSLLALLYFPDDQKYAVYIPLFLPIMIPVIMSMRQLVQYVRKPKITD